MILGIESCMPEKPQLETANKVTHHLPSGTLFSMMTCIIMMNFAQCFKKIIMSAPFLGEDAGCWIPGWQAYLPYCC